MHQKEKLIELLAINGKVRQAMLDYLANERQIDLALTMSNRGSPEDTNWYLGQIYKTDALIKLCDKAGTL